jgi:hypothetical protein
MSNLILKPNESPVQQPYDKYWDAPMTRREAHTLFMKLASNDNELMGMCDTAALVLNYVCEKKLDVKREDLDSYVTVKSAEVTSMREQRKKTQETSNDLGREEGVQQ